MPFLNENSLLKEKIEEAKEKLLKGINYLEKLEIDLNKKEDRLWNEIIKSLENNDSIKAPSLAKELFEIKKLRKIIQNKKQSLEMVYTRLSFVKELEAIAKTLASINRMLKDVNQTIPNSINDVYDIIGTATIMDEFPILCSEESKRILNEAAVIAKLRKESLKLLP